MKGAEESSCESLSLGGDEYNDFDEMDSNNIRCPSQIISRNTLIVHDNFSVMNDGKLVR